MIPSRWVRLGATVRVIAWIAALLYLGVLALVLTGSPSWSGAVYVLAGFAMILGVASGHRRHVTGGGAIVIGLVALVRCVTAAAGEHLSMTDAHDGSARFVGRVIDEGDVVVAGTRLLAASGLRLDDAAELPRAMQSAYAELRAREGDAPSPFPATYLGLQRSNAFDLVFVEPASTAARSDMAIVYLHGFAGNFQLPCWQVARAVDGLGVTVACPSTRWVGDWWTADGEATVRRTVEVLHARGIRRIVLAGLSNGGYGASRIAPKMRGAFVGLVLISGAARDAPAPGIPTLVFHGLADGTAPVASAQAYASRVGARFVGVPAGHFAMLVRATEHDRALRAFVRERLGPKTE